MLNSVTVSAAGQEAEAVAIRDRLAGLARLGYRQYGHPSLTVRPAAVAAGTLGFAAAVGAALIAAARRPTGPAAGVAVALGAGAAVVAAATLAATTPTFAPSQASYNAWTLPGVALLLASGLAAADRRVRGAAALGVLILLADDAVGATILAVRGSAFAHTSQRPIAERIARLGPDRTALVHDGGSPGSWMIYGPIRHRFDGQVRQYGYVGDGDGDDDEVRLAPYPETGTGATIAPGAVPARYLVVVRARRRGSPSWPWRSATGPRRSATARWPRPWRPRPAGSGWRGRATARSWPATSTSSPAPTRPRARAAERPSRNNFVWDSRPRLSRRRTAGGGCPTRVPKRRSRSWTPPDSQAR